jgi:cytochrome d ubiquinol oxidase subunit II
MLSSLASDLPLIWAGIIGIAVVMYVIMDGFDLGIGALFPFAKSEGDRDLMMASVKPFWDGNETWLVLGGGGMMIAFPKAYVIILPALYLPVIGMLLALIFRGVAFEFRHLARRKQGWNLSFAGGSIVASFMQGVVLGGLIQGIKVEHGEFAGGALDWLTPFALLCGLGVAFGYALLGATWLVMKTSGNLAKRSRKQAEWLLYSTLAFMAAVSLWTPLAFPQIAERWFSLPNFYFLWPVPTVTALIAGGCWWWLRSGSDRPPFFAAIALFLLGYLGLVISVFPYLVPRSMTIWQAASSTDSQTFMLAGTIFMLPVVIGYTVLVYWLFRGKVREGEGYH